MHQKDVTCRFVVMFVVMSERKIDMNSLLSSLSDKILQAWIKFSFSPPKKIQAGGQLAHHQRHL